MNAGASWLVFAGSILALSFGNVFLKLGMTQLEALQPQGLAATIAAVARTPLLPLGVICLGAQFFGMLTLFRWGWDVSVVVPVFGLNYLVTALIGQFWLGEPVNLLRWAGIAAMLLGIALIARSVPRGAAP